MTLSEMDAVVSETHIAAPPETVFSYFVDPDKMARWMGVRVQLEPRPGGLYAVDVNDAARARGEFVEIVPNSRVVFTFGWEGDNQPVPPGSSTVEVTLTPESGGTRVRLVHRGLVGAARDEHRHGWDHYLARLSAVASGGDAGPDPNANPPQEDSR